MQCNGELMQVHIVVNRSISYTMIKSIFMAHLIQVVLTFRGDHELHIIEASSIKRLWNFHRITEREKRERKTFDSNNCIQNT